jgi:hypothetical protein
VGGRFSAPSAFYSKNNLIFVGRMWDQKEGLERYFDNFRRANRESMTSDLLF